MCECYACCVNICMRTSSTFHTRHTHAHAHDLGTKKFLSQVAHTYKHTCTHAQITLTELSKDPEKLEEICSGFDLQVCQIAICTYVGMCVCVCVFDFRLYLNGVPMYT